MCRIRFVEVCEQGEQQYLFESVSFSVRPEDDLCIIKERAARVSQITSRQMNRTDIDNGWEQVRPKEVSPRAELRQPGHECQSELQRAVFELGARGPVAYAAGNRGYQLLSDRRHVRPSERVMNYGAPLTMKNLSLCPTSPAKTVITSQPSRFFARIHLEATENVSRA